MLRDRHSRRLVQNSLFKSLSNFGFLWLFSPTVPCPTDTVVYWVSASVAGFALICQLVFTVPLGKELKPHMKLIILVNQSSEVQ